MLGGLSFDKDQSHRITVVSTKEKISPFSDQFCQASRKFFATFKINQALVSSNVSTLISFGEYINRYIIEDAWCYYVKLNIQGKTNFED